MRGSWSQREQWGEGSIWWRSIVGAASVIVALSSVGCATASPEASNSEKPPPEVSDSTVEEDDGEERTVQASVEVEFDTKRMPPGIEVGPYRSQVRRQAQTCYNRRVNQGGMEAEGTMLYELVVTRNGQVAGSERMSTDLWDEKLTGCLKRVFGRLQFDMSAPKRPVYRLSVRLTFELDVLAKSDPPV